MGSREDDAYWNDKYDLPPDCSLCEYGCDCGPDDDEDDEQEDEVDG
jgi:hypothetical protein